MHSVISSGIKYEHLEAYVLRGTASSCTVISGMNICTAKWPKGDEDNLHQVHNFLVADPYNNIRQESSSDLCKEASERATNALQTTEIHSHPAVQLRLNDLGPSRRSGVDPVFPIDTDRRSDAPVYFHHGLIGRVGQLKRPQGVIGTIGPVD